MSDTEAQKPKRSYKLDWLEAFCQRAHAGLTVNAVALHCFYHAGGDGGHIHAGIELIGKRIGADGKPVEHRTVSKAIAWLCENGWLAKTGAANRGKHLSAEYALNIPDAKPEGSAPGGSEAEEQEPEGSHAEPEGSDVKQEGSHAEPEGSAPPQENLRELEESLPREAAPPPARRTVTRQGKKAEQVVVPPGFTKKSVYLAND